MDGISKNQVYLEGRFLKINFCVGKSCGREIISKLYIIFKAEARLKFRIPGP